MTEVKLTESFDLSEPVVSDAHGDIFALDIKQGKIELKMMRCGHRVHSVFTLLRLDVDDRVHINPGGVKVTGPHVHVYREGYNDRFAFPANQYGFKDLSDFGSVIEKFMELCNIAKTSIKIQKSAGAGNWKK
ncbi:hypothetical protein JXA12_04385 [Candidatus Woesearchaeota archaeon]|nr:hypothetical protein [Candidatus Woesearchaeota archaeon]